MGRRKWITAFSAAPAAGLCAASAGPVAHTLRRMTERLPDNSGPARPSGPALMRMEWRSLLFMHWRVPVSVLRPLVPAHFEIDTLDGSAWIGLVPFTMRDVSPTFVPRLPLPGITDFHECNVRTYVRYRGRLNDDVGSGVYFFSLDAASRAGVWAARRFFHLPYFYARMSLFREGDHIDYATERIDEPGGNLRCSWRVGAPLPISKPGELAHFLTERYALFTVDHHNRPRRCRIHHAPWPLRSAELLRMDDSLLRAAGIEVEGRPLLHHAERLRVKAWGLEVLRAC